MPSKSRHRASRRLASLTLLLLLSACEREPPPSVDRTPSEPSRKAPAINPAPPAELTHDDAEIAPEADAEAPPPPHPGPWLVVTRGSSGVYLAPRTVRKEKIGYAQSGGRVPVLAEPVAKTDDCKRGWYKVVPAGYVCGDDGTTDENSPKLKFVLRPPDLEAVLPYKYARNAKNGTPLYRSIPSREQMYEYEPYLEEAQKARAEKEERERREQAARERALATVQAEDVETQAASLSDAGALRQRIDEALEDAGLSFFEPEGEPEPEKPWWQRDDAKERLHEVTLEELAEEGDGILAKRMVTGFYVAVDKTFNWHGRTWYKTTKGLVAPTDRMWQTAGSEFKGVELGSDFKLPVGWVYGGNKSATTYARDADSGKLSPKGKVERFVALQLTGNTIEAHGKDYSELADGSYVRSSQLRVTKPGAPPVDLAPGERYIEVNLSEQTVVAFEGTEPRYATLISSGKSSKVKEKDHRTPTGEWRIREKHVSTTMDGNGTAAGDLPYSIEDVPYVMYFHKAYAVHGAFWHRNYGVQMSHGCVNLAPLDAKYLFFFSDPPVHPGWHGAWSSAEQPGTRVVVRE